MFEYISISVASKHVYPMRAQERTPIHEEKKTASPLSHFETKELEWDIPSMKIGGG